MRWGVEQRLEFIEFRLLWEGGINRGDIAERFGVSIPQASNDLSRYQELAPENLAYDRSGKRYVPTASFRPKYLNPDADTYLAQLRSVADGTFDIGDSWLSAPPPYAATPMPRRHVDNDVLRRLVMAIRERHALRIHYQSMSTSRPQALWRWISPHAFAFDGNRWHVRAYCHLDDIYKDFMLPRILGCGESRPAERGREEDVAWNTEIELRLVPNPELTDEQAGVIARDFGMSSGVLAISLRVALAFYFLRRLNIESFGAEKRNVRDQPVVLANAPEVQRALQRPADP